MSAALYDEILANLTWYQLNTEYNDSMYQYMYKIERELYAKVKIPLISTTYSNQDGFVMYNNNNQIPRFGTYECSTPEKEAYMDSALSCFLFQFPFFLEKLQIGWIGFAFVIPVMLISIFGGIKESYRWFILNQAIWDLFLCYDYICGQPTAFGWSKNYFSQKTCFYTKFVSISDNAFIYALLSGIQLFLRNASFIPVFHLALSRFICMYFPQFYKSFTKNGYKILIFILIFNVICIAIFYVSGTTVSITTSLLVKENEEKCEPMCSSHNSIYCNQNIPEYFRCRNRITFDFNSNLKSLRIFVRTFKYTSFLISPIMFLLSIICAGFLFCKIASQLKFQLKTNLDSFKQTIKISSVVGIQCLTMSVIFVITGIQKYMQLKAEIADTRTIYAELPPWLFLLQYYPTTASLNMIRIIFDSFIILTVLTGYSKCVVSTFKLVYLCITNPKVTFKKFKSNIKGESVVTIIAAFQK